MSILIKDLNTISLDDKAWNEYLAGLIDGDECFLIAKILLVY